jgi:hypothetical protein
MSTVAAALRMLRIITASRGVRVRDDGSKAFGPISQRIA